MRIRSRIRGLWDGPRNGPHCLPVPGAPGVTVNVVRVDWEPVGLCAGEENHTVAARYWKELAGAYPGLASDVVHVHNLIGYDGWTTVDRSNPMGGIKAIRDGRWVFRIRR